MPIQVTDSLTIALQPEIYCVLKQAAGPSPTWDSFQGYDGSFFSVTRTSEEWSVICAQTVDNLALFSDAVEIETDFSLLKILGKLDFGLVGVLAKFAQIFANANIPIFCLSTFNTDYFLIKKEKLSEALTALESHNIKWVDAHA